MNKLLTLIFILCSIVSNAQFVRFNTITNGTLNGTNTNTGTISGGTYVSGTFSGLNNTFTNISNGSITGLGTLSTQNANAIAVTGGSLTGLTTLSTTGNPVFDAGTGTNILTLRTGTITHNGTLFTFNNAINVGSTVSGNRLSVMNNSESGTGGLTGLKLILPAFTANSTTAQNGTDAFSSNVNIGIPTLTATNTGVATTTAANLYIAGDPIAGTNQAITNSYGLYNLGKSYFGATAMFNGSIAASVSLGIITSIVRANPDLVFNNNPNSVTYGKWFMNTTGNLVLQNSGTFTDDGVNRLQVNGNIKSTKLIGSSTTPTFTAGAGMGTSPTGISVSGNDMGGKITFTTGTSPTTGVIGTLTFSSAYPAAPIAIVEGANSNAKVGNTLWVIGTETTTTVPIINTGTNTLSASTQYVLNYQIVGR